MGGDLSGLVSNLEPWCDDTSIPFVDAGSGAPAPVIEHAAVFADSDCLEWPDMLLELGQYESFAAEGVVLEGHLLALNCESRPLHLERKGKLGGMHGECLPPESLWLQPAGELFTERFSTAHMLGVLVLPPDRFTRVLGQEIQLPTKFAHVDPQISHLLKALVIELRNEGPSGSLFVEALVTAIATRLGQQFGVPVARGGLGPTRLKVVCDFIDANLGTDLTLEAMADQAGVSVGHFTREFRQSLGTSPFAYVMRRRLEQARQALVTRDVTVGVIAAEFGFADQGHLTRLFKQAYGATPGRFARAMRASRR